MKKLMKMVEDMMVSVTFAEAGELETARRLVKEALNEEEIEREMALADSRAVLKTV